MVWYVTGSATIANGATIVTGTGTAFLTNCRVGDGISFVNSTALYQITNIASETQLTITPAFAGASQNNGAYAVVPVQGYQKDLADQVKLLLQQYGSIATSPSLQAFSNVTGGANLLAYFTSATGMTTTAFSPFARTILDDVDASSVQNTIGVYSKTSVDGFLAGKANKGANSDITSLSALSIALSVPQGGTGVTTIGALLSALQSAGAYGKSNILGTVSQTSGVPTGAIIETGTNSNGTYTRFADGTVICNILIGSFSMSPSSIYNSATITYPVAVLSPKLSLSFSSSYPYDLTGNFESGVTSTTCKFSVVNRNTSQTLSAVYSYVRVEGRWF